MKCPSCASICSDLRDVCPSCRIDLRGYKQAHGIKVTNPTLSYEALLQKTFKESPLKSTISALGPVATRANAGGESLFQAIFKIAAPAPLRAAEVPAGSHDEIALLFDEALRDSAFAPPTEVELSQYQLGLQSRTEETVMLFELAMEAMEDPSSASRYVDEISTSETKQVEARDLSHELAKVERVIDAPILGLKGLGKGVGIAPGVSRSASTEAPPPTMLMYVAPSPGQIAASRLVDTLLVVALALALTSLVTDLSTISIVDLFAFFRRAMLIDLLPIASYLLEFAVLLSVLYPVFCLGIFRRTPGMALFGIRVIRDNGTKLRLENLILRAFSMPLSLVSFTWLSGKRPLHERVSHTLLVAVGDVRGDSPSH